jgi:hypothetical protein
MRTETPSSNCSQTGQGLARILAWQFAVLSGRTPDHDDNRQCLILKFALILFSIAYRALQSKYLCTNSFQRLDCIHNALPQRSILQP